MRITLDLYCNEGMSSRLKDGSQRPEGLSIAEEPRPCFAKTSPRSQAAPDPRHRSTLHTLKYVGTYYLPYLPYEKTVTQAASGETKTFMGPKVAEYIRLAVD